MQSNLEDLLRAVRDRQPCAWDRLAPMLDKRLSRFFRRRVGEADANDLIQTTLEIIVDKLPGLQHEKSLTAWVLGVARNRANLVLRARYRANGLPALLAEVAPPTKTSPTSRLHEQELLALVHEEIERLSPDHRRAVQMELQGASIQAYANRENITNVAARGRRHRAHKLLQKRIQARLRAPAPNLSAASTSTPAKTG